jgi:hypothetical protein
MRRLFTVLPLLVGALPIALGAQDSLRLVAGRVRDDKARKLAGAEILDSERRILGTSDSDGWFSVKLPAAAQTIGFRRVGFKPAAFTFPKGWSLADTVTVLLTAAPQLLADLEVEARPWKPLRYAGTTKYDGLFRRQRLGLGSFLSREELDRRPAIQTLELLQGLPGVRISVGPPGLESNSNIQIARCSGSGSKVTVWVDGARLIGGPMSEAPKDKPTGVGIRFGSSGETASTVIEMLSRIPPGDIEMIEVYRGASQIPAEFHEDGCAVIAVWTRWNGPVETRAIPPRP